ncbi:MAG: aspartate ammonia-lyase [Nitrososphaerales archaeon]|nr:aspartate ammonia-lyase [Nitrososphaerales archaeon]
MVTAYRTESDSLGKKKVPSSAYYGIQTQRAIENFPISGVLHAPEFLDSFIIIKKSAAKTNTKLKLLDKKLSSAIIKTSDEILSGKFRDQFVVDVFQMGAGTSFNMNCNEVIANRSNQLFRRKLGSYDPIHPNDHVNMSQSTNDTFPTAIRLSVLSSLPRLEQELKLLSSSFQSKSKQFNKILKSARTHLQDAVPITLGQEFKAYSITINKCLQDIQHCKKQLYFLGIGGSAAGTGINTHPNYSKLMVRELSIQTKLPLKQSMDLRESMQSQKDISSLSSSFRNLSLELTRISNDLRLLSSGPRTGLSEINLPAIAPGSSIMPGKVNPSILEMVNMVCFHVIGSDSGVAYATQAGQLELNVMMPMISYNVLFSIQILTNSIKQLRKLCIDGITANELICRKYAEESIGLATILNKYIGYSNASKIAKKSVTSNTNILDLILKEEILTESQLKKILNVNSLTQPTDPRFIINKDNK